MKKDLLQPVVEGISIAVVLESEDPVSRHWNVYLVNHRTEKIENVLVSSKGYGTKDGKEVKTSTLRHSMGSLEGQSFSTIEAIDEQVFGLTNEYWLSFYIGGQLYDKKFIFLPESIIDSNLIRIPLVNKPGVMIGQ
ncbi:MAG: hypothetical protein RLZ47_1588 [Bacteroidota bacterium]|jgi:N-acetylmuramoyl-L-alanine amidase CwlA